MIAQLAGYVPSAPDDKDKTVAVELYHLLYCTTVNADSFMHRLGLDAHLPGRCQYGHGSQGEKFLLKRP